MDLVGTYHKVCMKPLEKKFAYDILPSDMENFVIP